MRSDMCCTFYPLFLASQDYHFRNEKMIWISGRSDNHSEVMIMSLSVSLPLCERRGRSTGSDFKKLSQHLFLDFAQRSLRHMVLTSHQACKLGGMLVV